MERMSKKKMPRFLISEFSFHFTSGVNILLARHMLGFVQILCIDHSFPFLSTWDWKKHLESFKDDIYMTNENPSHQNDIVLTLALQNYRSLGRKCQLVAVGVRPSPPAWAGQKGCPMTCTGTCQSLSPPLIFPETTRLTGCHSRMVLLGGLFSQADGQQVTQLLKNSLEF